MPRSAANAGALKSFRSTVSVCSTKSNRSLPARANSQLPLRETEPRGLPNKKSAFRWIDQQPAMDWVLGLDLRPMLPPWRRQRLRATRRATQASSLHLQVSGFRGASSVRLVPETTPDTRYLKPTEPPSSPPDTSARLRDHQKSPSAPRSRNSRRRRRPRRRRHQPRRSSVRQRRSGCRRSW